MYGYIYQQLDKMLDEAIYEAENQEIILVGGYSRAELAYGVDKLLDEYLEGNYNDLNIDRDDDLGDQADMMADEISDGTRFADYQEIISLASRLRTLQAWLDYINWKNVNPATIYESSEYNDTFRVRTNGRKMSLASEVINAVDALADLDGYLEELQAVNQ